MTGFESYTNEELLKKYDDMDYYDDDLNREIAKRAGLLDEYNEADGQSFEDVLYEAEKVIRKEN